MKSIRYDIRNIIFGTITKHIDTILNSYYIAIEEYSIKDDIDDHFKNIIVPIILHINKIN